MDTARKISARLTLTLYLLYGAHIVFIVWSSRSQKGLILNFFACVGLWKEPIRWSRSKDAFGNLFSRYDVLIDSLETRKLHGDHA